MSTLPAIFYKHPLLLAGISLALGVTLGKASFINLPTVPLSVEENTAVAKFGTKSVSLTELDHDKNVQQAKFDNEITLYDTRKSVIESIYDNYVLAEQARNEKLSVDELIEKHRPKVLENKEQFEEVITIIDNNMYLDMPKNIEACWKYLDKPYNKEFKAKIIAIMSGDEFKDWYKNYYLNQLKKEIPLKLNFYPPKMPEVLRTKVPVKTSLTKGDPNASVRIDVFSDPNDYHGEDLYDTVTQLDEQYGSQVYWVFHAAPLDDDKNSSSFQLAEASFCAAEQDKFWQFNDAVYKNEDSETIDWSSLTKASGLHHAEFMTCLNSHRHAADVHTDISEFKRLELDGTPVVIINGIKIEGASALEEYQQALEGELAPIT